MNDSVLGNILIVDDSPENLRLLSQMLTEHGYKVRAVRSGAQAITAAQASPPDLILLDIMMPEMDGYEVCRRLKADECTGDIPILFLSALGDVEDKIKAFTSGGVDFITKPFQAQEMLARVRTHLTLRDLNRELQTANAELARQIEELQAARDRQAVLRQTGIELSFKLSLDYVLDVAIDAAIRLGLADAAFIALVEGDNLMIVRALGEYESTPSIPIHEGITGRAIREKHAEFVPDVESDPDYHVIVPGTVAQISIPLITQNRVVGSLTLEAKQAGRFSDAIFEALSLLAAQVAIAIDNAMAYEERAHLIAELDAFAHTVAHDLKNLLSTMLGYSELASSYCEQGNTENLLKCTEAISHATAKMTDIIDALLLLLASVRETEDVSLSALDMQLIVEEAQCQISGPLSRLKPRSHFPKRGLRRWDMPPGSRPSGSITSATRSNTAGCRLKLSWVHTGSRTACCVFGFRTTVMESPRKIRHVCSRPLPDSGRHASRDMGWGFPSYSALWRSWAGRPVSKATAWQGTVVCSTLPCLRRKCVPGAGIAEACVLPPRRAIGYNRPRQATLAQSAEQALRKRQVMGSSPMGGSSPRHSKIRGAFLSFRRRGHV
jgi:DNA-binding response OmpR family regulator/putative methionine-R-sulfoxide reductase with GAF domain